MPKVKIETPLTEKCVLIEGFGWAHVLSAGRERHVALLDASGAAGSFDALMRAHDIAIGEAPGRILATIRPKPGRQLFGERR